MPRVIRGYSGVLERAHALSAADAEHALHGVGDALLHLRPGYPPRLLLRHHLVVVLQQRRTQRLGGVAHVDGPRVPQLFREMQQRAHVVQVEVGHEHAVYAAAGADAHAAEVRKPLVVEVGGVHADIKQKGAVPDAQQHAAATNLLPCTQGRDRYHDAGCGSGCTPSFHAPAAIVAAQPACRHTAGAGAAAGAGGGG